MIIMAYSTGTGTVDNSSPLSIFNQGIVGWALAQHKTWHGILLGQGPTY